jgi:archaellum biogenesis ATPase FlaH
MADVSLDDLIKKDKEQGRVKRLQQVLVMPFRNSNPRSSIKATNLITKPTMRGNHNITTPIKTSLFKKNLKTIKTIARISNSLRRERKKSLDQDMKRKKRKDSPKKNYSAHLK